MYFVIAILAVLTVALICYAIYLRWKSSTSKIRFALVVIGAMSAVVPTTIIALEQVRIVDLVSATINWIRTGTFEVSPVEGPAQIANYILIFALSYITLRSILIFSNNVFTNWHGRATAVDVALAESKQRPTVATVAAAYVRLRATGRHDVEVDPDTIGREFELSDPPPSPGWNRFARELVLAARRGLDLPENGWAPQLGAWFGFLNREPIAMVALRDWPFPQVEGTLDRIAASRADITRILICVDRGTASVDPSFIYKSIPTDVFYKDQLLFGSLYLQDYCNELIDRYESDDVFVAGHSLSSMFVRPRVKENDAVESQDLLRVISDWERSPGRTHLSLLGQFGQGKSTAALAFCAAWAKRYQRDPAITERVPLLIPLRGELYT